MENQAVKRYPFPDFPLGWYWIDFSENLPVGKLIGKKWMGRDVIAWRDEAGKVLVADAICPHLGAKLSPEFGGKLIENELVCPFHGLRYNGSGQCVGSPRGPIDHEVSLRTYPVDEIHGLVMAYFHPDAAPPNWHVPELPQDGWTPWISSIAKLRTHPQETCENGVDVEHLSQVHPYTKVTPVRGVEIEGALLKNSFKLTREIRFVGPLKMEAHINATVTLAGLGSSLIETTIDGLDMRIRQLALSTPIDGEFVDFVMTLQLSKIGNPNKLVPGLGLLPAKAVQKLLRKLFFSLYLHDISQDFSIWNNKRYLEHPRLTSAESGILKFRRFCEQFYEEASGSATLENVPLKAEAVRLEMNPSETSQFRVN